MTLLSRATLLAVTFAAAACSEKSGAGVPDAGGGGLVARDAGMVSYPAGPYGTAVGEVVEDATFNGYARFDDSNLGLVALHDYYNPDGAKTTTAGAPVTAILVMAGAVWCNPCVQEAMVMASVADKFLPAGVQILQDLYQGPDRASGIAATQADLDRWVANYSLPFPVFIDPAKKLSPYFEVSLLPFIMLLDARTMTSLAEDLGFGGQPALEKFICDNAPQKLSVCP